MSEFGIRKGLFIEKALAKKMGVLAVSQIHLLKSRGQASFTSREEKREGLFL